MLRLSSFDKLLGVFAGFIFLLIVCRVVVFNSLHFVFLLFNLFLAWIPYFISKFIQRVSFRWLQWTLLAAWLLFLPNAFYIVTDLIHLRLPSVAPVWLDAFIIFTTATAGIIMALASLYRAEQFLATRLKDWHVALTMGCILLASGFGVYLGRFLRWNSWDVIAQPMVLFSSVANRILFPQQHWHTWAISFMLAGFFWLLYSMVKRLPVAFAVTKKGCI